MFWVVSIFVWLLAATPTLATLLVLGIRIYNRRGLKLCTSEAKLDGKVVIVTGASSGLGKAAARDFANRGARVILACRNRRKAEGVADEIRRSSGNPNVSVQILDTSVLTSVREFARRILATEQRLDILVLNAGIGGPPSKLVTDEGLEMTMATNHFGHFLLVNILAGLLRRSKPSRVVVTSSQMHYALSKFNPKELNFEKEKYKGLRAYALSKMCNVLMTRYLAVYWHGKGVTINCLCPGLVLTDIFRCGGFIADTSRKLAHLAGRSESEGAQTIIHLAVSEEVADVTGSFFMDCQERKANPLSNDAGLIKQFWETSEDVVQLTPEERSERSTPMS